MVLVLAVGGAVPASAQSGTTRPQPSLQPADIVPPTATAPAVTDPVGRDLLRRQTLGEGAGDSNQVLTLDLATLDQTAGDQTGAGSTLTTGRGPIGEFLDRIAYWFHSLITAITDDLAPPSPESFAKSVKSKDVNNLWRLVGDAGYKLKEISTEVGVVPGVAFKFKYVRELSDGDINWLERKLERHARQYQDPVSAMQRMIIYTLLNINSSDTYFVSELQVKLLPLPKAQFTLQPWDSGLSPEHDALLRAIQGKPALMHHAAEKDSRY
jgi:hypothetical protein